MSSTNIPSVTENDTHINNDSQGNSSDRKIIRVGSRKSEVNLKCFSFHFDSKETIN